jgi:hypothetical protein
MKLTYKTIAMENEDTDFQFYDRLHRDLVFTLFLKNVPQNVPFFTLFP